MFRLIGLLAVSLTLATPALSLERKLELGERIYQAKSEDGSMVLVKIAACHPKDAAFTIHANMGAKNLMGGVLSSWTVRLVVGDSAVFPQAGEGTFKLTLKSMNDCMGTFEQEQLKP